MTSYRRADPYPSKHSGGRINPLIMVWHTTEGMGRAYLDGLFSGKYPRDDGTKISVHWAIYNNGDIVEYAPWLPEEAVRCTHAGTSSWKGRESCNGFSLGCEIEHVKGNKYPEAVIKSCEWLAGIVHQQYPDLEMVTHKDIAPLRKQDPTEPWKTDVYPRVKEAWEEAGMTVRKVAAETAKPEVEKLVRAGLLTKPEMYDEAAELDEIPTLGWTATMLGRIAEAAGLVPPKP